MIKTTNITQFLFQHAQYLVTNNQSSQMLLDIDYKNNTYKVTNLRVFNEALNAEAIQIAKDLLKRKHQVNFADVKRE